MKNLYRKLLAAVTLLALVMSAAAGAEIVKEGYSTVSDEETAEELGELDL